MPVFHPPLVAERDIGPDYTDPRPEGGPLAEPAIMPPVAG